MDWDKLRIFHAVADVGSLTHAGDQLHLSQSAVSRQIRALEEALTTTLFHRHARGLILTEQGELLFDATKAMMKRLDSATARIHDSEEEVFGEIKVTTTTAFGTQWLAPRLPQLYKKYPDLKIDLMLEERVLDLPMREADVAIRMKEPSQADLIRKRLMNVHMRLYASKEYLEQHGAPETIKDLKEHRLICQSPNAHQVSAGGRLIQDLLSHGVPVGLNVNNYYGVLQGVRQILGLACSLITSCKITQICSECCQMCNPAMSPFIWPTQKNCATQNGSKPSMTLSKKRSLPTGNANGRRPPNKSSLALDVAYASLVCHLV